MKNHFKKGITLIEIIIVFAVLALIFGVVSSEFSKSRERQVLKSAVSDILSSLNKARTKTLSSVNSSSYGVHFEAGQITIFTGTSYSPGATGNESILLALPAEISNVALGSGSGSSGNLYFERLSGDPSKSGSVTVSTPNFSKIISISATGAFSSN